MHSGPEVIAAFLISKDVGTYPSDNGKWPIFYGQLPDSPDSAIGIFDVDALSNGRLMRTGETMGVPGYQIRIRAKKYQHAREKAFEIHDHFDALRRIKVTVEDSKYHVQGIHQDTVHPAFIGPDPEVRMNFTINGRISYWRNQNEN